MATVRSRRRSARAVARVPASGIPAQRSLLRIVNTPAARTALVVVGSIGLAALAVAVVGPKRLERDVFKPLRGAIEPQAEKLWSESRPLRDQFARLFRNATPAGRDKLVKSFQSWIGHFHAT